jgi:hypothetical protein
VIDFEKRIAFHDPEVDDDSNALIPIADLVVQLNAAGFHVLPIEPSGKTQSWHADAVRLMRAREKLDDLGVLTLRGVVNDWKSYASVTLVDAKATASQILAALDALAVAYGIEKESAATDAAFQLLREKEAGDWARVDLDPEASYTGIDREPPYVPLLRRLCQQWRKSEADPRTGGGEVDVELLREVCDAFEAEEQTS